jgi:hypothetical protein
VGGITFMMSSHYALHITEGHLEWCVLGLMPWLARCIVPGFHGVGQAVRGGLLLASVLTFGAVHIPAVFLPFFSAWMVFESLRRRQWQPFTHWAGIVLVAILLSSVKLLPTLDFASHHPREEEVGGLTPVALLPRMFLDPRQALLYQVRRDRALPDGHFAKVNRGPAADELLESLNRTGMRWNFQEYGCYIGVVGILLAIAGGSRTLRRFWPLYGAGGLAGVVVLGATSPVDLWSALQSLPLYEQFRVPSRFLAAVVFMIAVAAAFGAGVLVQICRGPFARWQGALATGLTALLYIELVVMGWTLFGDIFIVPRVELPVSQEFRQRYGRDESELYRNVMDSTMYARLLSNSGSLAAYENLTVTPGHVRTEADAGYRGEAYLEGERGSVAILDWRMSMITIETAASGADNLIINQNFSTGWKARRSDGDGNTDELQALRSRDGLIAIPIDSRHRRVQVSYVPNGLSLGAWTSSVSLLLCALVLVRSPRASRHVRTNTPEVKSDAE